MKPCKLKQCLKSASLGPPKHFIQESGRHLPQAKSPRPSSLISSFATSFYHQLAEQAQQAKPQSGHQNSRIIKIEICNRYMVHTTSGSKVIAVAPRIEIILESCWRVSEDSGSGLTRKGELWPTIYIASWPSLLSHIPSSIAVCRLVGRVQAAKSK